MNRIAEQQESEVYGFDQYRVDAAKRTVSSPAGEMLPLKAKAFETLLYLIRNAGRVVERDEILAAVWQDTIVEENNLTQHISQLRHFFGERPDEHRYIVTVPGRGYKFVAEVQRLDDSPMLKVESAEGREPVAADAPSRRLTVVVFVITVLAVAVSTAFYLSSGSGRPDQPQKKSLAVLPFVNSTQDADAQYLSDGVSASIIDNLTQLSGVRVLSKNSSFRFRGDQSDTAGIASQLGVDALVTGDIKKLGDKYVISVQLVNASDDSQIWGDQFVKSSTDIVAVQNEVAQAVSQNLQIKLTNAEQLGLAKTYTTNSEAYQLYLRGRFHVSKLTPPAVNIGIDYFRQAIELDPTYALAYSGVSDGYRSLALGGEAPPTETLPKAIAAAQRAIEIDDRLAEGHTALSYAIFWYERDWPKAESEVKRALELNPNSASARSNYAHLLSNLGRHSEALSEAERARELDPIWPPLNALECQFLTHAGRTDQAIERCRKTIELEPGFWMPHLFISSAYIEKEMYPEAIAEARKATELSAAQSISMAYEAHGLAKIGQIQEARSVIDRLLKRSAERYTPPYHLALAYLGVDDREKALQWLEKGFDEHDPKMAFLKVDPKLNNLRSEPRFVALMKKMNF